MPMIAKIVHTAKQTVNAKVLIISAVLARMVFRLLRHAEPRNHFPVHLLLEEAHRYVASTQQTSNCQARGRPDAHRVTVHKHGGAKALSKSVSLEVGRATTSSMPTRSMSIAANATA
jgi:hypothetical protein